jgi:hypothetical protein
MEVVVAVEANLDVGTTRRTHPEPPAQVGKGSPMGLDKLAEHRPEFGAVGDVGRIR